MVRCQVLVHTLAFKVMAEDASGRFLLKMDDKVIVLDTEGKVITYSLPYKESGFFRPTNSRFLAGIYYASIAGHI